MRGTSVVEDSFVGEGPSGPTPGSPAQSPFFGKGSSKIAGSRSQWGLSLFNSVGQRATRDPVALLWSRHMDSLAGEHSPGPWWGEWLRRCGPRSQLGRTELSACSIGDGGFGTIVPLWSLHTSGVQESAIFSGWSPPTNTQVRDRTGVVESL